MKKTVVLFILIFMMITQSTYARTEKPVLNFAYYLPSMKNIDAKDIKISLGFWAKEMSRETELTMNSFFYKDIDKLKRDFDEKKIDVLTASPLVFIQKFDLSSFQNGFKSVALDDEAQNKLLIIVRKKSNINGLKGLRNKKIARLDSDIEELYLNTTLQKSFKQDANQFFKENLFVKKYSKAILKLFFKKVDACMVTESAFNLASEMNPQIKKRLKIIRRKNVHLASNAFFGKDVDQKKIKLFKEQAFKIHLTKRGEQILTVFKSDHIVESDLEDLNSVKKIYEEYLSLKK